jgi:hypothetical protein
MEVETNQDNIISDVDVIDSPVEVICYEYESFKEREKREKYKKEINKSKLQIKSNRLEILLTINTTTCDEVIFKKHIVDIVDKDTKCCVMSGVIQRYEFEGRPWDPDIVLVFEDGRRFCNDNFKYMFRYFIGDGVPL